MRRYRLRMKILSDYSGVPSAKRRVAYKVPAQAPRGVGAAGRWPKPLPEGASVQVSPTESRAQTNQWPAAAFRSGKAIKNVHSYLFGGVGVGVPSRQRSGVRAAGDGTIAYRFAGPISKDSYRK
jgi:hypothetical protein